MSNALVLDLFFCFWKVDLFDLRLATTHLSTRKVKDSEYQEAASGHRMKLAAAEKASRMRKRRDFSPGFESAHVSDLLLLSNTI